MSEQVRDSMSPYGEPPSREVRPRDPHAHDPHTHDPQDYDPPAHDPQAYDPQARESLYRESRPDDAGIAPGTKRLLALMGGVGVALVVGIGAYSLIGRSGGGDVPVVQADARPLREKPASPGGMAVMVEERQNDPTRSRLAPAVEEPNPRALLGPEAAREAPPPRARPVTVQLTAAKSEAEAQAAWEKLARRMPDVVGVRRPLFQKVAEQGQTPWRLRTTGFSDQGQAKAFCDQVKAKGAKCVVIDS